MRFASALSLAVAGVLLAWLSPASPGGSPPQRTTVPPRRSTQLAGLGLRTDIQTRGIASGYYQYQARRRGLGVYGIFLAEK